jgi:hypothetical protein
MKLYTLEEVRKVLGLSEGAIKDKVFTKKTLRSIKVDNKRYVSEYDLAKYIEKQNWKKLHPKKAKPSAESVKQEYQESGRRMTILSHKKDNNESGEQNN